MSDGWSDHEQMGMAVRAGADRHDVPQVAVAADFFQPVLLHDVRNLARYLVQLIGVGAIYFVAAKAGLSLASINPSATPIWPPTGLALAAVMLCGYRVCPAIFLAAFFINVTT